MDIVKNMRRYVASFSLAALIASSLAIGVAQAGTFNDVQDADWFFTYVEDLVAQGVISVNDNYYPARNANRAEMAKLITEAFGLTLVDNGGVETFNDVPADAWYYPYVETVAANGVVSGYKDANGDLTGYYGPGNDVTRAEAAKMLVLGAPLTINTNCGPSFPDVGVTDWFYDYVETSYVNSVIDGYPDGSFGPGNLINRAEIAKMVSNSMNPVLRPCGGFNVSDATALSDTSVEVCYNAEYDSTSGLMSENYAVEDLDAVVLNVTAAEASSDTMCVVLTTDAQTSGLTYDLVVTDVTSADGADLGIYSTSFSGYTAGALGTGDLNVELSSSTPVGVTLPSGATSVPMAVWNFGAGSEDAVLKSLVVHRFGVSALPGNHQVYLYEGNDRLTSGKTVNSTTNNATFNNLNLAIAAGNTRTITLRMDTGTVTTTGEVGFEIVDADQVDADAGTAFGSFPLQGDLFGLSTTSAGTITIEKNGTITNPKVGENDVTLAKFKMTAATEAASLEQLGLYLTGSVSTDAVENLELYVSGETDPIATVAGVNSKDLAVFVLDTPYAIAKGDTKSMWVKADLNTGRSDDTVKFYVDETTDVLAIGDTYGFGMTVDLDNTSGYDGTSCTTTAGKCSFSTLEGGDITISSSGPTAADVPIAGDDVELLNFSVVSVSDITFKNFPISLTVSESADTTEGLLNSTAANLTDIKIVNADTNEVIWGPIDADVLTTALAGSTAIHETTGNTDALQAYYLFTDELDMLAGSELNLSLRADIANTATLDGMTIDSTIELGTTYPEIRDINNKIITNSSSLVPASSISGKTMTVSSPSLALSLASVPVSGATEYVKGQDGVEFVGINAECGSASACLVTDVAITGYIDDNGNASAFVAGQGADHSTYLNEYAGSVWLEDLDGNPVAAAKSVQTSGAVTFDGLTWTIPAGETVILYVVGDLSSDAYKNSNGEDIAFSVAAGGITYEDDDNNSRTSTGAVNGTTAPTTYARITDGGSLTVAVDGTTPQEDIMVAGTADNGISVFKFTTTDEAFLVKKLSINARQLNLLTANLGGYDNNISSVTISYTNSLGETETKTSSLTSGTANFSGMDFLIAKDDDSLLSVTADLNTISGGATAAEFVDLNIAFNQFEAVAQGSGETYKAQKIDASVSATSDLDFGTISWVNSTDDMDTGDLVGSTTLGESVSFTIDDGAGAVDQDYPVGTLLCIDEGSGGTCSGEDIYVVTATSAGATELTVTATLIDDAGTGTYTDADDVFYALPGSGYLTGSNMMHVYEAKPLVSLNASSPSGDRTVSTTDKPFVFDITETGGVEDVEFRMAEVNGMATAAADFTTSPGPLDGTWTCTTLLSPETGGVSGSHLRDTEGGGADAGCLFTFDTTADLSGYSGLSAWVRSSVGATDSMTISVIDDGATNTKASGTLVADTWEFVDMPFTSIAAADLDVVSIINITDTSGAALAGDYDVDELTLYKEKIVVTGASDADFDTFAAGNADNLVAYLKDGSTTEFQGYWYSATQTVDATNISATLYPLTNDYEVTKGTSKTLSLQTDSGLLLHEDAGIDDPVTFGITLGESLNGTVTAGGLWWFESNVVAKWLGDVANSTFNSNTMNY